MIYLKAYTRLNLGDDLLIKTLCERYPNQKFCILADHTYKKVFQEILNLEILDSYYSELNCEKYNSMDYILKKKQILNMLSKKCDTVIYVGGSIFIESDENSIDRVKDLKEELSLFQNKYIIDANFGPYLTNDYLLYVKNELIPILNHITFRDIYSYQLFKQNSNVSYAPDLVFQMNYPVHKQKKKIVGISLIYHLERSSLKENYSLYIKKLVEFSKKFIDDGYHIQLMSFCSYEKDDIAIHDFLELIPLQYKKYIEIKIYDGNINEFLAFISDLEFMVGTRFHSNILAMINFTKFIPICYSDKSVHQLEDLKIKQFLRFEDIHSLNDLSFNQLNSEELKQIRLLSEHHFLVINLN